MGQITRTTNPTGLKQIDKKLFLVRVVDGGEGGRSFWLESFDYKAAKFDRSVNVGCVAHAGSTEEYFDLGPVSDLKKTSFSLQAIATDKPLRFRFIFNTPGDPLLVGYADGVRALDEAGNLGGSLVDIEPSSLYGVGWKVELPEGAGSGDKPNVLVERTLFPTAASAVNHPWFGVLVMPEVMRQIAMAIAKNPDWLDDVETWIAPWADFINALGVSFPLDLDDDIYSQQSWADEVVRKFAAKGIFRHHMAQAIIEMEGGE
ncbi:hypothetical protein K5D65_07925 [Pseudomonas cichorii]|nr:hypothetical protein [Pseudomonas cichorii]